MRLIPLDHGTVNLSHFKNGLDFVLCLNMSASVLTALFCSCTHTFLQTNNSMPIVVMPNVRYAVTSHPFSSGIKFIC